MLLTPTKALAILAFTSTTLGSYNDYYEHSNYAPQRQGYGGYHKQLRQQQLQAREALEEEYLDDLFEFIARQAPTTTSKASATTSTPTSTSTSTSTSATSSTSSTTKSGASATPSANADANKKKEHEVQEKIKKEKEHIHHAESRIKHYTHMKHKHQEAIKKMEEELKKQKPAQGQLPKRWLDEFLAEWDI